MTQEVFRTVADKIGFKSSICLAFSLLAIGYSILGAFPTKPMALVSLGFILLGVLPKPVLLGVMRGGLAILGPLTISILLGIGLLMMLARVSNPVEKPGLVSGTLAALTLTIAVMTVTRHQVRVLYLEPATSQFQATVVPQWGNFILFAVLLVLGLATVFWMVRRVLTSPAEGDEAA